MPTGYPGGIAYLIGGHVAALLCPPIQLVPRLLAPGELDAEMAASRHKRRAGLDCPVLVVKPPGFVTPIVVDEP